MPSLIERSADPAATASGEWRADREVTLIGVAKVYGDEFAAKEVVKDCSFRIEEGKFTVLIGPSGCGKTTLINLIAGYEQVVRDASPVTVSRSSDQLAIVWCCFKKPRCFHG